MSTDNNNVRLVHEDAIMPDPSYARRPLEWFLGRCVKLAFQGDCGRIEHMWVEVNGVTEANLTGIIANEPLFVGHISHGDPVNFSRCEIEAVDLTEREWWDEVFMLRARNDFFNRHLGSPTKESGFVGFYGEHFTPRQALARWVKWQPHNNEPLTFMLDIAEK
jgi:hypothetical protein